MLFTGHKHETCVTCSPTTLDSLPPALKFTRLQY